MDHHHEIIDDYEIEHGFTKHPLRIRLNGDYFHVQIPESCQADVTEENEWITLLREMAKHQDLLDSLWMTDQEQFDIVQHVYDKPLYTTESWFHPETHSQLLVNLLFSISCEEFDLSRSNMHCKYKHEH
ncbi:hypothetical protein OE903_01830 [Bacillus sp. B6(2022)]|nr:hypothetical protein [Bacillus sp. B6(2022)]